MSAISDITAKSSEINSSAAKVGAFPLQLATSAAKVVQNGVVGAAEAIRSKVATIDVTI